MYIMALSLERHAKKLKLGTINTDKNVTRNGIGTERLEMMLSPIYFFMITPYSLYIG